ncbi:MAG: hypothetical protein HW405_26 [Candidatus Berkelbacteria bacterium]|nr:hypothetical protein [Candidatus Berkelbacteria bacterium]
MYCSNCGHKSLRDVTFCGNCGNHLTSGKVTSLEKINLKDEDRKKLKKVYQNAGNSSFAIGIVSMILAPIIEYFISGVTDAGSIILYTLIDWIFILPFVYFGSKIKSDDLTNLNKSLKRNRNMLIYSVIYLILILILGGRIGILFLLVIYYFAVSYSSTKKVINQF